MVNVNLLKAAIVEAGYNQAKLSAAMKWAPNTTSAKVNGRSEITLCEARCLCEILNIHNAERRNEIFFAKNISN
ncbi:MAG: helix-turn-helix transcriptional regulator [Clostridia bacterium]|nr:helix-turn-helix transcriptional regulator [Clostridia bacterium]